MTRASYAWLGLMLGVAWTLQGYLRGEHMPIGAANAFANFKATVRGHAPPRPTDPLAALTRAFEDWRLTGPLRVSIPPAHLNSSYTNVVYLQSVLDVPYDVLLFSGDFPHPHWRIDERAPEAVPAYHFENRSANGALVVAMEGRLWPFGYSAWIDYLTNPRAFTVVTPTLVAADGEVLKPVSAYPLSPLNSIRMSYGNTTVEMSHLSPIVWKFARAGKPSASALEFLPEFVYEEGPDGAFVSWLPQMPSAVEASLGLMTLEHKAPMLQGVHVPTWWRTDEALRQSVITGGPLAERRAHLAELAQRYPRHPYLAHYQVVAALGSAEFTAAWLARQKARCDEPTWYLLPWTEATWEQVAELPCRKMGALMLNTKTLSRYFSGALLMRFYPRSDLDELAKEIVAPTPLKDDPRSFNYAVSDLARLWLDRAR